MAGSGLVAQAEALYEYYLSTRLSRAAKAVKAAQVELMRDSDSVAKAQNLRRAEEEVRMLRSQLAMQAARTAQALRSGSRSSNDIPTDQSRPSSSFTAQQAVRAAGIADELRARSTEDSQPKDGRSLDFTASQARRADRVSREREESTSVASQGAVPFISDDEFAALRRSTAAPKR